MRGLALLSVADKTGIVELAVELVRMGHELVSTGGTAAELRKAGVPVTPVESLTRMPEMLDGRVKTLHPAVHGGILARRDVEAHMQAIWNAGIRPIDVVVVNLYPFAETVARPDVTFAEAIEQIDIGGPSMVRSAAKNHASVVVVVDPADYKAIAAELRSGRMPPSHAAIVAS
jgi:phosphoribosylaminoimidazolecarboxamide formyltransferase/IMP cyclohydrolase